MSSPSEFPDEWPGTGGGSRDFSYGLPRRAAGEWEDNTAQGPWPPPAAEHWEATEHYVPASQASPPSSLRNGLALFITFAVVTALILGVGLAGMDVADDSPDEGGVRTPMTPGPLTTPSVAPEFDSSQGLDPSSPPDGLMPSTNPDTGKWELPPWQWDALPVLVDGADAEWSALQSPQLAGLAPPKLANCGAPGTVSEQRSYEQAVREQWRRVHEAWAPTLRTLGLPDDEPGVRFYPGTTGRSQCGKIEAPAFYCPLGKGTAHFGGDVKEVAMYWDLMIKDTVHHEYAHHIQNLIGIMNAADTVTYTPDIDRRVELQATCWASAMTIHDEAVEFDDEFWDEWHLSLQESIPDEEHGTLESLRYWGTRGLYAKTLGDCNTWSVAPERVS